MERHRLDKALKVIKAIDELIIHKEKILELDDRKDNVVGAENTGSISFLATNDHARLSICLDPAFFDDTFTLTPNRFYDLYIANIDKKISQLEESLAAI